MQKQRCSGLWALVLMMILLLSTPPDRAEAGPQAEGVNDATKGVQGTADPLTKQGMLIQYASAALDDRGPVNTPLTSENTEQVTIGNVKRIQCKDRCTLTVLSSETGKMLTLSGGPDLVNDPGTVRKKYLGARVKVRWHMEKRVPAKAGVYKLTNVIDQIEILP
jgi:hypothetical protein